MAALTLVDTGPLVAIIDRGQKAHARCRTGLARLRGSLVKTGPCLTETMYFLGDIRGWSGQKALWALFEQDWVRLHTPGEDEWRRARELMEKFHDTPMDLADASLVATAENLSISRIFTLDSDFLVYRLPGNRTFDIVP